MAKKKLNDLAKRSNEIIDKYMKKAEVPTCIGCKKTPDKIKEYQFEDDPIQFVLDNEPIGCWGPHSRNKFYCTDCYIKAGSPLRR